MTETATILTGIETNQTRPQMTILQFWPFSKEKIAPRLTLAGFFAAGGVLTWGRLERNEN
jgi:hypothetical protein